MRECIEVKLIFVACSSRAQSHRILNGAFDWFILEASDSTTIAIVPGCLGSLWFCSRNRVMSFFNDISCLIRTENHHTFLQLIIQVLTVTLLIKRSENMLTRFNGNTAGIPLSRLISSRRALQLRSLRKRLLRLLQRLVELRIKACPLKHLNYFTF